MLLYFKKQTTASARTDDYWRKACVRVAAGRKMSLANWGGIAPSEGGTILYLVSGHVGLGLPGFLIFQKY